jgi:hypothetical protein
MLSLLIHTHRVRFALKSRETVRGLFLPPNKTFLLWHLATYHFLVLRSRRITCGAEGVLVVITGVFNMFPYENSAFLFVAA